ncbi:FHA domain-containing serine/threonine-protein kinase [Rhodohalobacter sp.]|uniref:FHA domain-containing serine/threonine-protein kinase n=1 Tax=Rhodohalobacter sp. TaxID=1974210 RepID=UPI002ACDADF9|nr:FHA domain-containing serine/threonine-protein kinase [Rhodohalobacter sp.]MDZ7755777.1 FHA domain-containing serine/threonine-protein kinase [Rhodohalobacter sp.]
MSSPGAIHIDKGSKVTSKKTTYRVENELGEGGFGSVYQISDMDNMYAMKLTKMWTFMPHERIEFAKRFRQEYDYGSRITSPYIVRSHDFDMLEGNPFMVMDLCSGGNLRDLVGETLNSQKVDEIAHGILMGLKDLHDEGIIHRDIKPENILFDNQRVPKLADFGISASIKKRHTVANFMGHAKEVFATGTYSPPEQIDPKQAMKVMGPSNDVYAFGAMMYELITRGKLPFGPFEEFMKDMAAYEQKKKEEMWDRAALEKSSPNQKWVEIISRCIRYQPEDRFGTIDEVLSVLGYSPVREEPKEKVYPDSDWILRVQNGEEIGREYHLTNLKNSKSSGVLTIGWFNSETPFTNDIGITEYFTEYISNYHATLEYSSADHHWYIRDGQWREKDGVPGWYRSTNGVLVQGSRVDETGKKLNPGDIIAIGDTTLKVVINQ